MACPFSFPCEDPISGYSMLISLFITCYNDTLFPETGKAVVTVLERLGQQSSFGQRRLAAGRCTTTPAINVKRFR